jgi:hypothetical protein
VAVLPPEPGHDPFELGLGDGHRAHHGVGEDPRGHLARIVAEVGAQHAGDVVHPHELARREEALARGGR